MGGVWAWQLLSFTPAAVFVQLPRESEWHNKQTPPVATVTWVRKDANQNRLVKQKIAKIPWYNNLCIYFWEFTFIINIKCLLLQIHRCSRCGPDCALPSWPSCSGVFCHRCCHCLCEPTNLLFGTQVTLQDLNSSNKCIYLFILLLLTHLNLILAYLKCHYCVSHAFSHSPKHFLFHAHSTCCLAKTKCITCISHRKGTAVINVFQSVTVCLNVIDAVSSFLFALQPCQKMYPVGLENNVLCFRMIKLLLCTKQTKIIQKIAETTEVGLRTVQSIIKSWKDSSELSSARTKCG